MLTGELSARTDHEQNALIDQLSDHGEIFRVKLHGSIFEECAIHISCNILHVKPHFYYRNEVIIAADEIICK